MSRIIQCQRCGKEKGMDKEDLKANWCPNCGKHDFLHVQDSRLRKNNKWKRC